MLWEINEIRKFKDKIYFAKVEFFKNGNSTAAFMYTSSRIDTVYFLSL